MMPMRKTLLAGAGALALAASAYQHLYPHDAMDQPTVNALMTLGILASSEVVLPPSIVFIGTGSQASGTTLTFTNQPIGTAAPDRVVVVAICLRTGGGVPVSATIGGIATTFLPSDTISSQSATLAYAVVPTGTTATIVINCGSSSQNCIGVYALYNVNPTHTDTGKAGATSSPISINSVTIPVGGFGIFATSNNINQPTTWSGATSDFQLIMSSTNRWGSGATSLAGGTTPTVQASTSSSSGYAMIGAAWGPA
jgi:hypothetical protein